MRGIDILHKPKGEKKRSEDVEERMRWALFRGVKRILYSERGLREFLKLADMVDSEEFENQIKQVKELLYYLRVGQVLYGRKFRRREFVDFIWEVYKEPSEWERLRRKLVELAKHLGIRGLVS